MSYANYPDHGMAPAPAVPFSEFTAPMMYIGEAIYGAFETAAKAVHSAFAWIVRKVRAYETVQHMSALDERTLQDIGVGRSEIRYVAQRAAESSRYDYGMTGR